MKIKTKEKSYSEVMALPKEKHKKPIRQLKIFRMLLKAVSQFDLKATNFTCEKIGMEKLGSKEPCLFKEITGESSNEGTISSNKITKQYLQNTGR